MNELKARIRNAMTGPLCSIPTPFRPDEEIDYDALAKMIDFQIENHFGIIFLTPGNSHYNVLTDDEMAQLGRFCVEYTRHRVPVCITEFGFTTKRALAMARFAKEIGADLFLPWAANWGDSVTSEALADFYVACGEIMPLMLIDPSISTPEKCIGVIENVMRRLPDRVLAIKDDNCGPVARRMTMKFADETAIFAGGTKENFLNILPYGAVGFLSTFGMFRPDIAWNFYEACKKLDMNTMRNVIRDYEMPYFDYISSLPGNFDAGIKGTMELFGFGTRLRRLPYRSLTDAEMDELKQKLIDLKILR